MDELFAAIDTFMLRLYGEHADLMDLSRIILLSQQLHGYTHQIVMDLTRSPVLVTETVEDIPVDEGWLPDPVAWLNEADADEMRKPSTLAVKTCYSLDNAC